MKNLGKLIRPTVIKEEAYSLKSYPDLIKLNQNELPYDLPEQLKEELFQRLKSIPFNRYPLPQPMKLKKRMADLLEVSSDQVEFSNGSNVMIQALILASSIKGGKVMIPDPTFSVYEIEGELMGDKIIKVPLNEEDFSLPLEKFLSTLKKQNPNIVFIANPNAPTGNLFPEEVLLEIVKRAKCLVVVDEAYFQFSQVTLLPSLRKYPNLVIVRTFSKGFGLGGVRIGYLVARKEIAQNIAKILLPYCLSVLSEETAHFVLDHLSHFDSVVGQVISERESLFQQMQSLSQIQSYPSAANFVLFKTKNSKKYFDHLVREGILIRDVSSNPRLKNCLRVSIGAPEENQAFLKALSLIP